MNYSIPDVWLDFTGRNLVVYIKQSGLKYTPKTLDLDLNLNRNLIDSLNNPRKIQQDVRGWEDHFLFQGFHRFISLIVRPDVRGFIWKQFFENNRHIFLPIINKRWVVALVPTRWIPEIAHSLVEEFRAVFGGAGINICTQAVTVLFNALWKQQERIISMQSAEAESIEICVRNQSELMYTSFYRFVVQRVENKSIIAKLAEWHYRRSNCEEEKESSNQTNAINNEYDGYKFNGFIRYLLNEQLPRVDIQMDTSIGVLADEEKFFPVLTSQNPVGSWVGMRLHIIGDENFIDLPLAACLDQKGSFFLLDRLTINNTETKSTDTYIDIFLKQINYEEAVAHLRLQSDNKKPDLEKNFRLPRLYH